MYANVMPFKKTELKKNRIECVYIVGRMEPIPHKYQDDYIKVWKKWKNIIFLGRTSSGSEIFMTYPLYRVWV